MRSARRGPRGRAPHPILTESCGRRARRGLALLTSLLALLSAAPAPAATLRPPDPLAAARFLAAQRAGFGAGPLAARRAAAALRRAQQLRAHASAAAMASAVGSAGWSPLGPASITGSYFGGAVSGRVNALAVAPSGEIYAGTAGGGVWSSTDGGKHWVTTTDQVTTGLAIGALAIDPAHPQIVYAGTGDANDCGDCFYGGGVLKSTDGGENWTVEDPVGFSGVDFAAMAVDPGNDQHLYAATSAGLYESANAGADWSQVTTGATSAVVVDPGHPSNVYVATPGTGIRESTDGGATFTTLGGGLPDPTSFGVTALGISHPAGSPSATLYAAVAPPDANGGGELSMFKSTDGGATWTQLTSVPDYTNQSYAYGTSPYDQGAYDNTLAVDAHDPNHVIAGGISALESTDGGNSWTDLNGQDFLANPDVLHPDFHAATFTPSGTVLLGSDGGVFGYDPSTPGPGGVTDLNTDLDTGQTYQDIGVAGAGSTILAGFMGDGTALGPRASGWAGVDSGDGGSSAINPLDSSQQFAESDGALDLTSDGWNTSSDITPPGEPSQAANLVPPLSVVANPASPDAPTVYYGGADLWATSNPAAPSPTWTQLTSVGLGVSAIASAPSDPDVLYVGFDDGTLEVSTDATSASPTFTDISPGVSEWITHIAVSPSDPGQIALSFSSSNTHSSSVPPMVQLGAVTLAGTPAASFTDETGDLPTGVASDSVLFDAGDLVVATDVGVFSTATASLSGGSTSWQPDGAGLPNVQVLGLTLDGAGNLYAATYGRGIWELGAPIELASPQLSGTAVVGQTLTETPATWSGSPTGVRDQWLRCPPGGACTAIPGASAHAYRVTAGDVGDRLEVQESATNATGTSASATSAAVGPVAPGPSPAPTPTPTPAPKLTPAPTPTPPPTAIPASRGPTTGQIRGALRSVLAAPARARTPAGTYLLAFTAPGAGRLVVAWLVRLSGAGRRPAPIAVLHVTITRAGRLGLRLVLNARGRRLLAHQHRVWISAAGTFTTAAHDAVSATHGFWLSR